MSENVTSDTKAFGGGLAAGASPLYLEARGVPMSQTIDRPELSPAEWKLIQDLRSLPDAALRDRMQTSIGELLFFFRTPRCQGIGIEGFPCGDPRSSCEDCHQIWDMLDRVAERSRKA
jgi:hypothetical protein